MTIEIALLSSGVSLAFAVYQGIANLKRNTKADNKKDAVPAKLKAAVQAILDKDSR